MDILIKTINSSTDFFYNKTVFFENHSCDTEYARDLGKLGAFPDTVFEFTNSAIYIIAGYDSQLLSFYVEEFNKMLDGIKDPMAFEDYDHPTFILESDLLSYLIKRMGSIKDMYTPLDNNSTYLIDTIKSNMEKAHQARIDASKSVMDNIFKDNTFIAFDVETSNSKRDSMNSISAAKFVNGEIVETFDKYLRCEDNFGIWQRKGLKFDRQFLLENGEDPLTVLQEFEAFVKDYPIVYHSGANFDANVYYNTSKRYGHDYNNVIHGRKWFDTKKIYADNVKLDNYKLNTLCDRYDIELEHHVALSDSIACGKLLVNAIKNLDIIEPVKRFQY
ncbi:exonuclease domain-containing protein [Flammeovirga aprica]|uniref:Exonuclease domain-containing protein n=1 Tax=Flammeovirga aprica JL-4 TaxID=694437 RepID=A0A7X9XB30_9BACT|nr:exonuclease domain-containing protein [Flammeovirga aprica]NME70285.1 hypothetical protein [Flammeovirga aprica JL-4]